MKKIVVAIDFSETSINTLLHAITIADRTKSDIIMVWVNKMKHEAAKLEPGLDEEKVKELFEDLIRKYKYKLPLASKFTYEIRYGKVYREIIGVAKEVQADLLMSGTHGRSGFEGIFLGSNAYRLVMTAPCPVITIRPGTNVGRALRRILLPLDSSLETRQKVPITTELAKIFKAKIYILAIFTTNVKTVRQIVNGYTEQVEKHLADEGIEYETEYIDAENETKAAIEHAQKIDANLISIMTEQETSPANILMGRAAQQMINQSDIPILSVHSKQTVRVVGM